MSDFGFPISFMEQPRHCWVLSSASRLLFLLLFPNPTAVSRAACHTLCCLNYNFTPCLFSYSSIFLKEAVLVSMCWAFPWSQEISFIWCSKWAVPYFLVPLLGARLQTSSFPYCFLTVFLLSLQKLPHNCMYHALLSRVTPQIPTYFLVPPLSRLHFVNASTLCQRRECQRLECKR